MLTAAAVLLIAVRIWYVNKDIGQIPVHTAQMGEEVPVGDNVFNDDNEDMSDYSFKVTGVEFLTYEEYQEKYEYVEEEENPLFHPYDTTIPEMILDVDVTISNINPESKQEGGIMIGNYRLYGQDFILQAPSSLIWMSNPVLKDMWRFSLRGGTSMDFHLPFGFRPNADTTPITVEDIRKQDLYLVLSLYPEKWQVLIEGY